jgi:uncharacterized protein (TIGR02996 family)
VFFVGMAGTEEELIRLAATRPDDPMPRLVFADWCEERDPERAEFVRLTCLPEMGPKSRSEELLRARDRDWAGALPELAHAWHFHKGLVTRTEGEQLLLSAPARDLWRKHAVHHLRLHLAPGSRLPESPAWPAHLRRLELAGNEGVARVWFPKLHASLPATVDQLVLERCGLDTETTRVADRTGLLAPLTHLELRDNRMFGDNALRALAQSSARQLRSLSIHHANITPVALGELLTNAPFPLLEELRVVLPAAFPAGPALHALFPKFQTGPWAGQLRHLELAGLPLGVDGYLSLALNRGLNLERLGLAHGRVGSEGQHLLQGGAGVQNIGDLDLSGNDLETQHAQVLARSTHWGALEKLNLGRNRITDGGVKSLLEDGPIGRQLTWLDLSRNRVGGPGLMALAVCTRLKFLALGGNYLGHEAIEALWEEGALPALEELDFSASPLEEKILRVLRTRPRPGLKTLALSDHAAGMLTSKPCPALGGLLHVRLLGKPDWRLARNVFDRTGALDVEFIDEGRAWRRNRHALELQLKASG